MVKSKHYQIEDFCKFSVTNKVFLGQNTAAKIFDILPKKNSVLREMIQAYRLIASTLDIYSGVI